MDTADGGENRGIEPEEEIGQICSFSYNRNSGKAVWREPICNVECEHVEVTLDSGASVPAFPKSTCKGYRVVKDARMGRRYKCAGAAGQYVNDEGGRIATALNENGRKQRFKHRVADVHKPLAAASALVGAGNNVLLRNGMSYIVPERSGFGSYLSKSVKECEAWYGTADVTPVREKKGVYVFNLWIVPGTEEAEKGEEEPEHMTPVAHDSATFPRLARWP